jgi:hypothetical protein
MMNQTIEVQTQYSKATFNTAFEAKKYIFNEAQDGVEAFLVYFTADEEYAEAEVDGTFTDDDGEEWPAWTGTAWIINAVKDPNI